MDPNAQPTTDTNLSGQFPVAAPAPTQDPETTIEAAALLADPSRGEISPAADQSNRGNEMAARMAPQVTPVRTIDQPAAGPKLTPEQEAERRRGYREDIEGNRVYIDPDELEEAATEAQEFPRENCLNCLNHGRENKLNENGFCPVCGFKLDRVRNIKLEPAAKTV